MNRILGHTKIVGLLFLALIASGLWLTMAIFSKQFTDYDRVSLESSNVGLQLPARADVKIRGVQVGEVLDMKATSDGAVLTLGLYPDQVDTIPANVTARIEPKTLFGEKYVALQVPGSPDAQHIRAGATITQTKVAAQVEQTLNDLYPLLRAVEPADLNKTLTALATALEGRGDRIGENLEILDSYLKRINPQLPALIEDLRLTARTSDLYADVLPEIATTLRNTVKTGNTLLSREDKLKKLFSDVSRFSEVTGAFLDANEENLIRVGELSAQQLRVIAKYAPEFPCMTAGIIKAGKTQAEAFRGFVLHVNLEVLPNSPREYGPQDTPVNGAKNGAYCGTLPDSPYSQKNPVKSLPNFNDGVEQDTGKGTRRVAPGGLTLAATPGGATEADLIRGMLAGMNGSEPSDLGVLLLGPMVRGTEVSLR
ncbi:MCE family protein [Nocardioides sp. Soil796]|uniref:MCE family protein n=1 Tax=Nocardioides sp. Soil796 TaxID=1736412 RepID=UPI00070C3D77|nr:MCE family protein [Nocardioides sp. Soil796]KRF12960.1 virulence factor Mce [Nocardioides sp. Soil796]